MTIPDWLLPATDNAEFFTDERCYIQELLNTEQSPDVSVAIARVEPGVTTQLHCLTGVSETYILSQGTGVVEVNHERCPVATGDKIFIPADVPQRITNTGRTDLLFYCVCTPRFEPTCYVNLEDESPNSGQLDEA